MHEAFSEAGASNRCHPRGSQRLKFAQTPRGEIVAEKPVEKSQRSAVNCFWYHCRLSVWTSRGSLIVFHTLAADNIQSRRLGSSRGLNMDSGGTCPIMLSEEALRMFGRPNMPKLEDAKILSLAIEYIKWSNVF